MIVDRTALPRPPAQNQTLEVLTFINEVSGILFFREEDVRLDLRTIHSQIRNESSKIRQFHLFCPVFQLIDCTYKIHYLYLTSTFKSGRAANRGVSNPLRKRPCRQLLEYAASTHCHAHLDLPCRDFAFAASH